MIKKTISEQTLEDFVGSVKTVTVVTGEIYGVVFVGSVKTVTVVTGEIYGVVFGIVLRSTEK